MSKYEIYLLFSWRESFVAANVTQHARAQMGNNHQKSRNMTQVAFVKGWKQARKGEATRIKEEIKTALNVKSNPTFYRRMKGCPEPTVTEARKIEDVFHRFGIYNIWGNE
jgi:hypothetical protein